MAKKVYIGGDNSVGLPSGYTQLTHIESTGLQWFDTGVPYSTTDSIVLKMKLSYTNISGTQIMGFSGDGGHGIGLASSKWWEVSNPSSVSANTVYNVEWGKTGTSCYRSINGTKTTGTYSNNSATANLILFAAAGVLSTPNTKAYFCYSKLEAAEIYVNDVLVRNYIPAKNSSGVVSLYDTVNKTFGGSASSGTFVAGTEIPYKNNIAKLVKKIYIGTENPIGLPDGYKQLAHIESTGSQWFDTGVAYSQTDSFVLKMKFEFTNISGTQIMGFSPNAGNGIGLSGSKWWEISNPSSVSANTVYDVEWGRQGSDYYRSINGVKTTGYDNFTPTGNANIVLFAVADAMSSATKAYFCYCKMLSAEILVNNVLVRSYTPAKDISGKVGLYDSVEKRFGGSGSGEFVAGTEVPYVSSIARRVRKGYIGINGKASQFFGRSFENGQKVADLSVARQYVRAASTKDYAIFAGGVNGSTIYYTVDAFNSELTRSAPTALGTARRQHASSQTGGYVLFAGGRYNSSTATANVDAYDNSLTRSFPASMSEAKRDLAGGTVGDYAIFAGGGSSVKGEAYNTALTKSAPTVLSAARYLLASASVGDYVLFAGGCPAAWTSVYSTVDAVNKSLTRSTATALSVSRCRLRGGSNDNYAIFAGGVSLTSSATTGAYYDTVDAYNASLTRSIPAVLSGTKAELASVKISGRVLFGGGQNSANTVDSYDNSLTKKQEANLFSGGAYNEGTAIGDIALMPASWTGTALAGYAFD